MPLALYTKRVRDALKQPVAFGPDLFLLALVGAVTGIVVVSAGQLTAPYQEVTAIDLSLASLPRYTLLSLSRGFAAYALSLVFTLVYGTIAAHSRRAERLMIPALDVLQAIPVLGFLPGLVLAMIALFPDREAGLEVACILMIFTGQVWNMTFSFHASLRSIPQSFREVAAVQRLSRWQFFRLVELPSAMIGLVWNSMLSMAGGWFFLTVNEAFTLGNRDFRLPGVGAYMHEAIEHGDTAAMIAAVAAMIAMIIFVDQVVWRPLTVWSQRFKLEETAGEEPPQSWVADLLRRSRIYRGFVQRLGPGPRPVLHRTGASRLMDRFREGQRYGPIVRSGLRFMLFGVGILVMGWGVWSLLRLLLSLPLSDPVNHEDWAAVALALLASFLRTSAAVALGAAWAVPAGVLIGLSPKWSRRLQPVIQVVASFPAPMLFPLVTMLLAFLHVPFTVGCVVLLLLGAQWYILFNVIAGARAIPDEFKEVAAVYRMGGPQRWVRLYLPCVFPYLVTGLVTAAGGAWNATIVAEYLELRGETFAAFGLGATINHATAVGNYPLLAAGVVTMALSVVLINRLLWKRLYRLAEERYGLGT
ncbi:MAG TPA: ABC transporter permease subunit [Gemmataceae bacterium]|nr:ABC transporter permease subunit [Gemmataceae bacterium]